jgi:hypothetical protein
MKDIEMLQVEDIKEMSDFVSDEFHHIYGFTVILRAGEIKNYFLMGTYSSLKDNIDALLMKYNELRKNEETKKAVKTMLKKKE